MSQAANTIDIAPDHKQTGKFNSDRMQLTLGIALIVATGIGPSLLGNSYWEHTFQLVNIYIAVAVLQNFLFVDAGQKSFGQGAIVGLGAYGLAIASGVHGWPLIIGALVGVLAAGAGGLLFALPALRVQGFHLGFATLSAAIVFPQLLIQFDGLTQGINGISLYIPALTEPLAMSLSPLTILVTLVPIAALLLHYTIRNARLGRRMRIAAESAEAARSLGINSGFMRSLAFIIVALGTGVCGALYVPTVGFISPQGFIIELSFIFFFAVVVGGRGQLLGPIVGIWVVYILPNVLLVQLVEYRLLVNGALTLAVVILFPDGLVGTVEAWRRKRNQRGGGEEGFSLRPFTDTLMKRPEQPIDANAAPIIDVEGVTKRFGSVVALDGVNMQVRPGEVHGLVGANGSGKTSLLNVISGFSRADAGSYSLAGRNVTRAAPVSIARMGLGRTFQTPRIFPDFSVWDNIRIGLDAREAPLDAEEQALVERLRTSYEEDSPRMMSHGQRRLLEVVRVSLAAPRVVLFDEPAAGLSPSEREEFAKLVRQLSRRMGMAVILVEHDLDLVWGIADRITVLETGKVVASDTPQVLADDPAVQHLFVGGAHA
ncbi:branched-chain amino acid ABC transporter ATP-binding protein/permease [Oceanibium sediminis]|uniref:branched-chain amino acid ABC transporter ATP-binding protein/permease n=1 Tax=Oceanibium sediminis TaxID=2026339 RepID=UPI000DD4A24D|nr:ATP-binding cassette domain-containing protein [Oceanibium sediminis]